MISKLAFLAALIIFIVMAVGPPAAVWGWIGFACVAGGLLLQGYGPDRL